MPHVLTPSLLRLVTALVLVGATVACTDSGSTAGDIRTRPLLDAGVRVDAGQADAAAAQTDAGSADAAGSDTVDASANSDAESDATDTAASDAGQDAESNVDDVEDAGDPSADTTDAIEPDTVEPDTGDDVGDDANVDVYPVDDIGAEIAPCDTAGDACDDGDACTDDDVCTDDGICVGTPRVCPASADVCGTNVCEDGICVARTLPDASMCDDGDPCTDDDRCFAGVCDGLPRICPGGDGICSFAICTADSAGCMVEKLDDGTTCDDGDACTQNDACVDGFCVGSSSGMQGALCNDSDACTGNDRCDDEGSCVGTPRLDCTELDGECQVGACIVGWEELECASIPVVDGVACEEGYCRRGDCAPCTMDAFDPADDTPIGAREPMDSDVRHTLCPDDVDHLLLRPREGRATGVVVRANDGCDGLARLSWTNEDGELESDERTGTGACPVAMVSDTTTLTLEGAGGFLPGYSLETATFLAEREPNDGRELARAIDALAGWTWAGRLTGPSDEDWFVLELDEPRRVVAETGRFLCGVDTVMTLLSGDGRTVVSESDDAVSLGRCSRLELALPSGTWFLRIRGYGGLALGRYTLDVRTEAAPTLAYERERNDARETANGPWEPAVRIEAELTGGDEDWFAITTTTPGTWRAYTDDGFGGCAADTVLSWAGPGGSISLTNDDEPGRGFCSELQVSIEEPGITWFRVTGFDERTTGPYVLTVAPAL